MKSRTANIFAIAIAFSSCASCWGQQKIAFVVGNYSYSTPLDGPEADLVQMSGLLKDLDFDINSLPNATRTDFYKNLKKVREKVTSLKSKEKEEAIVVLYYSGHGIQSGGENYFLPVDVTSIDEHELDATLIQLRKVIFELSSTGVSKLLVVIDACRTIPHGIQHDSTNTGSGQQATPPNTIIAFSSAYGQASLDGTTSVYGKKNTSIYTGALLRSLVQNKPLILALNDASSIVQQYTAGKQTPHFEVSSGFPSSYSLADEKQSLKLLTRFASGTNMRLLRDCSDIECPQMVELAGGEFEMGSPSSESGRDMDEGPIRKVTVKRFAISRYEISFDQWDRCVADRACENRSYSDWGRGSYPAGNISWTDAKQFTAWISRKTGKHYRLPSEAEWEYAARAGGKNTYGFGDKIDTTLANYDGNYGSVAGESRVRPLPVGSLTPNDWGIYDMYGNVWEWVEDCYHDSYVRAPDISVAWSTECKDADARIVRGGGYYNGPESLRSANRGKRSLKSGSAAAIGFRVVREVE